MIVTARQLEDLHKQNGSNGHVTLPYRARLTPLASDWIRARKVVVGYGDVMTGSSAGGPSLAKPQAAVSGNIATIADSGAPAGAFLWWCDGPCGPAKAAVIAQERESSLRAMEHAADPKQLAAVVKSIAAEVKSGRASGAILLVQHGAMVSVFANRCPSLRAILGTSMDGVEQGVRELAANVLIIEHPQKTLQQVKNLLARFTRAKRNLGEDVQRQLQEMASCG